jgi:hypothetical protein
LQWRELSAVEPAESDKLYVVRAEQIHYGDRSLAALHSGERAHAASAGRIVGCPRHRDIHANETPEQPPALHGRP